MSTEECVICMLPPEECGPFTTENYCPLIHSKGGVKPHQICVQCRDSIEQKYGGVKIPPYTKKSKVLTCFGCGCRVGDLPKNQEVISIQSTSHGRNRNTRNRNQQRVETLHERMDRWRREESLCGILWRMIEGVFIVLPIIILTIFYGKFINYINCQLGSTRECYFLLDKVDNGHYFIGFIMAIINIIGCITCCVICQEDRIRSSRVGTY